jgi:fluoroacetyl-CoA thioesterase
MQETLVVGIGTERTYKVTDDMAPPHLPVKVISTPSMIQLIEGTCLATAQEHLDAGEATVGTHVCVSHVGMAASGEEVTVACELTGIERRRLTFAVKVTAPAGVISEGTHQRHVLDTARLG